jgi:hypothetical protein
MAIGQYSPSGMPPLPSVLSAPATPAIPTNALTRPSHQDYRGNPQGFRDAMHAYRHPTTGTTPGTVPGTAPGTPAPTPASASSAFNNFANSAGMQFAQQQSANAINNLYAAHGALQSGGAMKAISDRAQQIALQDYFMPYMQMVNGVSAQGAQAGAAVAGVGSSFGNTAAGINNNLANSSSAINGQMGGAIQNGANGLSNAAIANGAANAGMWSNIGGALGTLGSSFFPTHA